MNSELGMCDKRQYEHNGPHLKIGENGQNLPPFPCINWHPVADEVPQEFLGQVCIHCDLPWRMHGATTMSCPKGATKFWPKLPNPMKTNESSVAPEVEDK